jgi:hypothetical protein
MNKRTKDEIKEFFSRKLELLSRACASFEVTAQEFRVLYGLLIGHLSNDSDWCQPKDETLGKSTATGTRSVGTHTRSLQAKGWLIKTKRGTGASDYSFPPLSVRQDSAEWCPERSATSCEAFGNLASSVRHTVCRTEPSLEPSLEPSFLNKRLEEEDCIQERKEEGLVPTDEGLFEVFWAAYPNRVNKPAARRAFAIAIQTVDLDTLLAGVQRYADTKPTGTSWMNPATFLRNEGWHDERGPMQGGRDGLRVAMDKLGWGHPPTIGTLEEFLEVGPERPTQEQIDADLVNWEKVKRQIKGALK